MVNAKTLLAAAIALAPSVVEAAPSWRKWVGVQGHRGGLGYRPESTLYAFAHGLEIGVDVLEMDTVFTKDGVSVIWHDHSISAAKCKDTAKGEKYVGKFIANLTLAQVKTLDCGSLQQPRHPQQKLYPGATIPTLEEVLELVNCYGDRQVEINLETKLDPLRPNETLPLSAYIDKIVPVLQKHNFASRTYIQSFDWRTLIGIKKKFPSTRTVALLDDSTIVPFDRGVDGYPWLGGIDLEKEFKGDYVAAAKSIGAIVLSPVHGVPSNATVNTPGYKPFVTAKMVEEAHRIGLQVIPWTVNDESTMDKLMTDGVDAIISDYPERVRYVGHDRGFRVGQAGRAERPQCLKKASVKV